MDIVIQISQFLLSLSILIILHELGHFIPAKIFKTRVEKFYLFFDPWFSLFKFKKGETEYGIGWLPLGGYVKISGMVDESMDKEQMAKDPEPWEFRSKPAWQRLIIMCGGVIVNILLAMLIYAMVLFVWGKEYLPANNATYGVYCDSLALGIGFQNGDKIVELGGKPVPDDYTYGTITKEILLNDDISSVVVDRNGEKVTIDIPEGFENKVVAARVKGLFQEQVPFFVDTIHPETPAAKSDLKKGDRIIAINEISTPYFQDFIREVGAFKEKEVSLSVLRDNDTISFPVMVSEKGTIGVRFLHLENVFEIEKKTYGFVEAIPAGIGEAISTLDSYVQQFKLVFTKEGIQQIGGFGTIGGLYEKKWNWQSFWATTGFISIILAFMNILPIPALDGGHVMFLLYEIITGRKPNQKILEYAQMAGMIFLLAFMLYANGLDVLRGCSR